MLLRLKSVIKPKSVMKAPKTLLGIHDSFFQELPQQFHVRSDDITVLHFRKLSECRKLSKLEANFVMLFLFSFL